MARQQLGPAPSNTLDAATKAYVDSKAGSGSGGGNGNVYIQQSNPNMQSPGQWWQIDGSGNLVTLWVETASTTYALPTTGLVNRWSTASLSGFSNGATVNTWNATTGDIVLQESTAAPVYLTSGLNSKPGVTFNGTSTKIGYSSGTTYNVSQPYTLVAIVNLKNATDAQQIMNMNGAELSLNSGATGYTTYSGTALSGGTVSTGGHLLMIGADSGGAGTISVDGTTVASGNIGTNSMASVRLGAHPNGVQFANMDGYEFMAYSRNLLNSANASDLSNLKGWARQQFGLTVN